MEFRILGPLEVFTDGRSIRIGSGRPWTLLALLLLRANQFVGLDEVVEALWGDAVPAHPRNAVHTCVTRLRNSLGAGAVVEWAGDRVRLVVDDADVDLCRFEAAVREAHAAGIDEVEVLRAALGLWRGDPLADIHSDYLHREVVPRLVERRLQVLERRIELDLAAGRHNLVLPELQALTGAHPLREPFWAQLVVALSCCGRQADALDAYARIRTLLADELGIEPGEELRRAHEMVLAEVDSSWVVECQLPIDVADFVDRDDELGWLLDAFRDSAEGTVPVVTISGPPGIGKSALAIRAAHRLIPHYPDGQWFLRLNGASSNPAALKDLLAELLSTLRVDPRTIPDDVDRRAAMLRSRLASRKVLLLLDDAGSVEQVAPLLPGRPGSAVVITSRSELAGISVLYGGDRLLLKPLPVEPAYNLLARIVGDGRCAKDVAATKVLADMCGRLPLALRIAAANLASRPKLGVSAYAEDLGSGDRLTKLRTRGEGGIAVRAAFDVSYVALDDRARRAFCLLGDSPCGDTDAHGAAALFGCAADEARELLDRLVAANLLENQSHDRYIFHDLLRVYAGDCARADLRLEDRGDAFRRLADWYLHSVHAAVTKSLASLYVSPLGSAPSDVSPMTFATDDDALKWLNSERVNYLSVIEHAGVRGLQKYVWLLPDAARPDLFHHYRMADLERVAELGLKCARQAGNGRGEAMMLLVLGSLKSVSGRYDESLADLCACRARATAIGEAVIIATAVISIAAMFDEAGRVLEAAQAAQEGLELVNKGVEQGEGRRFAATVQLARSTFHLGDLRRAAELIESILPAVVEYNSPITEVIARLHLGEIYRELGYYHKAFEHVEKTLEQSTFRGLVYGEGGIVVSTLYRDIGDIDRAIERASGGLRLAQRNHHQKHEADAHVVLGSIHLAAGRLDLAIDHCQKGYALSQAVDTTIRAMIGTAAATGSTELATEAVALARKRDMRLLEAKALTELAGVAVRAGEFTDAHAAAEVALVMHRESGCRLEEGRTLTILGQVRAAKGESGAVELWQEALTVYESIGSPLAGEVRGLMGEQ